MSDEKEVKGVVVEATAKVEEEKQGLKCCECCSFPYGREARCHLDAVFFSHFHPLSFVDWYPFHFQVAVVVISAAPWWSSPFYTSYISLF